jgi:hypothetical protein
VDLLGAKDALDQALLDYEAHVGAFMQTGAEISTLRSRAQAYVSSSDAAVAARAQAVIEEANAALAAFKDVQTSALQTAQQASATKSEIENNPQWRNLVNADLSLLGYATLQAVTTETQKAANLVASLGSLEARMDDHLEHTMPKLRSDEQALEDLAAGRGVAGVTHGLIGSLTSSLGSATSGLASSLGLGETGKWIAISAVVLLVGPVALQGLVGALAPRPLRNPRRRRRYSRRRR